MSEGLAARQGALEGPGLIRRAAGGPETGYAFRHVLALDAACESMLNLDRRRLHHDVVECLERIQAGNLDEYAPIPARDFDEGGDDMRDLGYLIRAADSAASRYANRMAALGVRRGLWRTWLALLDSLNAQGRDSEAREAKQKAREEIAHTASRAGSDDLQFSFLTLPNVPSLLEDK